MPEGPPPVSWRADRPPRTGTPLDPRTCPSCTVAAPFVAHTPPAPWDGTQGFMFFTPPWRARLTVDTPAPATLTTPPPVSPAPQAVLRIPDPLSTSPNTPVTTCRLRGRDVTWRAVLTCLHSDRRDLHSPRNVDMGEVTPWGSDRKTHGFWGQSVQGLGVGGAGR